MESNDVVLFVSMVAQPTKKMMAQPAKMRISLRSLILVFMVRCVLDWLQLAVKRESVAGVNKYLASVSEDAERQYLDSPRYAYLIAELEGRMAGFIAMRDNKHLFHLFVAAAHQRTGIARALWEQARQLSLRAGPIAEFTVNSSLNAVPVYRSFGFVPAGVVMQVHGIAFLPMRLTLHNAA